MRFVTLKTIVGIALFIAMPIFVNAQQSTSSRCGFERWNVKVLSDPDAKRVRFDSVVETSIQQLNAIPIPEIPYPLNGRIAPHELTVYRIRAVVIQILTESDGDWHIILGDSSNTQIRMIGEIPSPECAANDHHRQLYATARSALRSVPRRGEVVLEGVGFFDFIHNQKGRAKNGFELHPVLFIAPFNR
jgi:hypothetical protein